MEALRRRFSFCHRLGLLAVLALALLPTLSRVWGHQGPHAATSIEVCTAQGMVQVAQVAPGEQGSFDGARPVEDERAGGLSDCGHCTLASAALDLPATRALLAVDGTSSLSDPASPRVGPRATPVWRNPPTRAPPWAV